MADSFRRNLTYDEAPKGTKNEDWVPGETEEAIRAAIARVNGGDMDERTRRRKLEGVLAQFFDATRGTSSYEMYRAHLEQTANEVTDLFAALGDVEPLESVLVALGGAMITVHLLPPQNGHDTRVAVAVKPNDRRRRETHGTGPTIDAAVRAAVANAKDGEQ